MNNQQIYQILKDWNFWGGELLVGIKRPTYLKKMQEILGTGLVLTVTGSRRSGKSYLLRQLAKELMDLGINKNNILILNFEDSRWQNLDNSLLNQIFQVYLEYCHPQGQIYLLLDEIQQVSGWEKWVRTAHELNRAKIVVSGSNSKLLSRELATTLTGRHLDIRIMPLSYAEFLQFRNLPVNSLAMVIEYLQTGGFPEAVLNTPGREILGRYFLDIINNDLVRRYGIRKNDKIFMLANFYQTNFSALITNSSLGRQMQITTDTVIKFSSYLETVFLNYLIDRWSTKLKVQHNSPKKVYSIDTGLALATGFFISPNWGRLAENAVFLQLERSKMNYPDREIYYWKDNLHREVDFVIKDSTKPMEAIQVCWDILHPDTRKRECGNLVRCLNDLGLTEGKIITSEFEAEEKIQGKIIRYTKLSNFLI